MERCEFQKTDAKFRQTKFGKYEDEIQKTQGRNSDKHQREIQKTQAKFRKQRRNSESKRWSAKNKYAVQQECWYGRDGWGGWAGRDAWGRWDGRDGLDAGDGGSRMVGTTIWAVGMVGALEDSGGGDRRDGWGGRNGRDGRDNLGGRDGRDGRDGRRGGDGRDGRGRSGCL